MPQDRCAPRLILDCNATAAPVAVAGHTHGGQIRLPVISRWFWLGYKERERLPAFGWMRPGFGAEGNALYVNRGIGFSDVPVRINCPPEVTLLTLERA